MDERTQTRRPGPEGEDARWRLSAGESVGAFRVLRPLGRGGMGEVYEVEQVHLLKRYALKVLAKGDTDLVGRFRQEARVMADMRHPNLVSAHYFDVDEFRGFCYFVMDYVSGTGRGLAPGPAVHPSDVRTLADLVPLPGHRLAEREVRRLATEVCDALSYAHGFGGGIVHRDLKLSNILLNADGHAFVSDFGVAKILGMGADAAGRTLSLGTSEYMAPEQREGRAVSPRTDLYALGVILYRLLVGYLPVGRWAEPSRCGVGCARGWDRIVSRCLAVDPDARYADAAAVRAELLALRLTAPDGRRKARRQLVFGGAAAVFAALFAAGLHVGFGVIAGSDAGVRAVTSERQRGASWRVVCMSGTAVAGAKPAHAVDGDPQTVWRPRIADREASLELDLDAVRELGGVVCRMPFAEQLGDGDGAPVALEVSLSRDRVYWSVASGTLSPAREGDEGQFLFETPLSGRHVRIRVLEAACGRAASSVPELGFLLADGQTVRLHL